MTPEEFHDLARFVKRRSGIALGPEKRALATSKLKPVVARFGFKEVAHLARELNAPGEALARDVIGALTTNETSFFRDRTVFDHIAKHILPPLFHASRPVRRARIWCAAASTGQEPYSVAMLLEEARAQTKGWTVEILASDIAADAISRAREARYDDAEVARGMPADILSRFFNWNGKDWRLDKSVRARVSFGVRNLIEPFADLGTFDVIFCRNVLIYFDMPTKQNVLERLAASLGTGGHLILGASETLRGFNAGLEPVDGIPGVYRRPLAKTRAART